MASFSVITNVAANNAQANLYTTNIGLRTALTRLSSGFRINQAGDDAAGLAVANAYRFEQVAVLNQGMRNANDGLSTLQIKNGALDNISTLLDRLSTLASQSASAGRSPASARRSTTSSRTSSAKSPVKSNVAGLGSSQGFSVFVSGNAGNGTVGGTDRRGRHDHLGITPAT